MESELVNFEQSDPSRQGGFAILYDREVPVDVRHSGSPTSRASSAVEPLRIKILANGEGSAATSCKIELTSENDLFFHFVHVIDSSSYAAFQNRQRLSAPFIDYPTILMKTMNNCIKGKPFVLMVIPYNLT